jgi:hypothetical protein
MTRFQNIGTPPMPAKRSGDQFPRIELTRYIHFNPLRAGLVPGPFASAERPADDRVLRDGDFVEQIWSESAELKKETLRKKYPGMDLKTLARDIAADQGITEEELLSGSRKRKISQARSAFCRTSVGEMGYPAAGVARFLRVTTSALERAARAK